MTGDPLNIPGIPGYVPPPGERRRGGAAWLLFVIASLLAAACGLIALGGLASAFSAHPQSRGGDIFVALVSGLLCVRSARWAIRLEHRARSHQPLAQSFTHPATRSRPASRRRHYGPVGASLFTAVFGLAALGCVVGGFIEQSDITRSIYTQEHGVRRTATVLEVDNSSDCSNSSCTYSAVIEALFEPPIDGSTTTLVHYPNTANWVAGNHIDVLVDPKQPSYAEVPGAQLDNERELIPLAIGGLLFGLVAVGNGAALRRMLAHRRAQAESAPALPSA
jgi:hypothetical protein